jgi:hypothetical protein
MRLKLVGEAIFQPGRILGTVAGNIHDIEQLRKAVQVFIVQHAITTPMVILRTLFKFK